MVARLSILVRPASLAPSIQASSPGLMVISLGLGVFRADYHLHAQLAHFVDVQRDA